MGTVMENSEENFIGTVRKSLQLCHWRTIPAMFFD